MTRHAFSPDGVAVRDESIASDTAGIRLHLRNKRIDALAPFTAERTIVMIHGATYAAGPLFDLRLGGLSLMDHLAIEGFDVHALDVRGYGGSTREAEMEGAPEASPPLGGFSVGLRDLGTAVDHVLGRRGLDRVNVFGMSWGGSVAGAYAARMPDRVARLALVAPLWLIPGPARIDPGGRLGAYRRIPVRDGRAGWLAPAPERKRAALIPPGWFEAWADAALASDPEGPSSGTMRAVTGPVMDVRNHWTAGRPLYDPAAVTAPTLVVHAEWNVDVPLDAARDLFGRLGNARYRRWVEIGEGTHMVLLERNRLQAYRAVSGFLAEDEP